MKIQHNLAAMNANRNLKINVGTSVETTEKLSSGYRINHAADDAAGLSISEKMRRLIRGLAQASLNCQDGISLVQTAEGALHEVHDMLQRMNVLAVQSANGTNAEAEREALQQEFAHIQDEIDRVSETTTFNDISLFVRENGGTGTTKVIRTNYVNPGNIPSVTSAGGTDGSVSVKQTMSPQSIVVRAASVQCGDFTVTGGTENVDFRYANNTLTILSSEHLIISGTGATTTNRIAIQGGTSANVTLNNVNIDVSSAGACALRVNKNASLNLTLTGKNTLKSADNQAGLQVADGTKLVITKQSTGSLNAIGGARGAGIGGNNFRGNVAAGTIIINGGTITATGGRSASGIGGGNAGSGGTITINGGTVHATGGAMAAGIGGGSRGAGGNITISGGMISAIGGSSAADIGRGASTNNNGSFSTGTNGNAVITTKNNNVSDTSNMSNWDCIIKNNTSGTVYGDVELIEDYTVAMGDTLNIPNGSVLTTPSGKVLTNDGTINNDGAMINNGTLINNGIINGNAGSTLDNNGTLMNDGTMNNNTDSTLENDGIVDNNGTLTNDGTVNNNPKGIIDNSSGGTIDNTNGTINNNDGKIIGPIVGNQPLQGINSLWIQAGADVGYGFNIRISIMNTKILGIKKNAVNILTKESSGDSITAVSEAIGKLSEQRSRLGVYQNRLEHTIRNLDNVVENTTSMESQIRDTDMAKETVKHSNSKIIMQAAQAMLVQANQQPADILLLFEKY